MSENKEIKELNIEELDKVAGGNIIDDATYEFTIPVRIRFANHIHL